MNKIYFIAGAKAVPAEIIEQLSANNFTAEAGQIQRLTQIDGSTHLYVGIGQSATLDFWTGAKVCQKAHNLGGLEVQNPEALDRDQQQNFALSWLLESYRYGVFKQAKPAPCLEGIVPTERTCALAAGIGLARDLINTPANHMRPGDLANQTHELAKAHDARVQVISGDDLADGFPLIQGVGGAAGSGAMAPNLIDLQWGHQGPQLTLVGKGITFDTGGLNLKPTQGMRLMKKDMGGAAHVLGLAHMIMTLKLPLRLRVLIPAAENSVSQGAFRPGDILKSRAGLSVEIDNTDAEGRLVLADALTYAQEGGAADLIISMATLTGAARVALGPAIAPYLSNNIDLTWQILAASDAQCDPLWPLPLFDPYQNYLDSDVADLVNSGGGGFAGAITAALFLKQFITTVPWAHFDIYAWNPKPEPGRPKGGAAQGLISLLNYLESWTTDRG